MKKADIHPGDTLAVRSPSRRANEVAKVEVLGPTTSTRTYRQAQAATRVKVLSVHVGAYSWLPFERTDSNQRTPEVGEERVVVNRYLSPWDAEAEGIVERIAALDAAQKRRHELQEAFGFPIDPGSGGRLTVRVDDLETLARKLGVIA